MRNVIDLNFQENPYYENRDTNEKLQYSSSKAALISNQSEWNLKNCSNVCTVP